MIVIIILLLLLLAVVVVSVSVPLSGNVCMQRVQSPRVGYSLQGGAVGKKHSPLKLQILLESNPLKPRLSVQYRDWPSQEGARSLFSACRRLPARRATCWLAHASVSMRSIHKLCALSCLCVIAVLYYYDELCKNHIVVLY